MNKKELISGIYRRLSKKLGRAATGVDLQAIGITSSMVKYNFGNLTGLRTYTGIKAQPPELEAIYEALGVKK
jgi:hypothetical protein